MLHPHVVERVAEAEDDNHRSEWVLSPGTALSPESGTSSAKNNLTDQRRRLSTSHRYRELVVVFRSESRPPTVSHWRFAESSPKGAGADFWRPRVFNLFSSSNVLVQISQGEKVGGARTFQQGTGQVTDRHERVVVRHRSAKHLAGTE